MHGEFGTMCFPGRGWFCGTGGFHGIASWIVLISLCGLFIYLLIRIIRFLSAKQEMRCSGCQTRIETSYLRCPGCGNSLKGHCQECNKIVESSWKFCPHCNHTLQ